jgi:hypothetical protein
LYLYSCIYITAQYALLQYLFMYDLLTK